MRFFPKKGTNGEDSSDRIGTCVGGNSNREGLAGSSAAPTRGILKISTQKDSLAYHGVDHTILTRQSSEGFEALEPNSQQQSSSAASEVRFSKLEVRLYNVIPETNPSVSEGPAIGLDWTYQALPITTVDVFEENRPPRRDIEDKPITFRERVKILKRSGATKEEIQEAIYRSDVAREERMMTLRNMKYEASDIRREKLVRGVKKALRLQMSDAAQQKMLWKNAQVA